MQKLRVNLFDGNFAHSSGEGGYDSCSEGRPPTRIEWVRGLQDFGDGITVWTDKYLLHSSVRTVRSRLKVAWSIEPRAVHPVMYDAVKFVEKDFDVVYTFDDELLARDSARYVLNVVASSRIRCAGCDLGAKSRGVSMIASGKNWAPGHQLRHEIMKTLAPKHAIEPWGRGYRCFDRKEEALSTYFFSIAVMNSSANNYFTEILVDCFRTGTIPIFWGAPNIGAFFNEKGIIRFTGVAELDVILGELEQGYLIHYQNRWEAARENMALSEEYLSADDILAKKLSKLL